MHTSVFEKATFIHDGDYHGDVTVWNHLGESFTLDGEAMLQYAAEYARSERISSIEQADYKTILNNLEGDD